LLFLVSLRGRDEVLKAVGWTHLLALFAGNTTSPESGVSGYHRYFPVDPI